jgi:PAS domain-containing protein
MNKTNSESQLSLRRAANQSGWRFPIRFWIGSSIPSAPLLVKDQQHRWVALNDAACDFTGFPRQAIIGKTVRDLASPG